MLLAKRSLLRKVGEHNPDSEVADLEKELLERINATGIGPQAWGGRTTALAVNVETYPTHITALPVGVNIQCQPPSYRRRLKMSNNLTIPLTDQAVEELKAGDEVTISGVLYTARDAAHKRMVQALARGEKLPFDIKGKVIYYVGPTPPRPGQVIGSAGPTTSVRMDPLTPPLLEAGLKGMIGKGGRGQAVRDALERYMAVYFGAIGGASALLSRHIKKAELVAYDDLGTEAVRRLYVEDFPVIVVNDIYGNDLLKKGKAEWRKDLLCSP